VILKLLLTGIFAGAAVQKFAGKVARNWDRWGYSRQFMYATGIAEVGALVLFWWPGLELVGARRSTCHSDPAPRGTVPCSSDRAVAVPGNGAVLPVNGAMTWKDNKRRPDALAAR